MAGWILSERDGKPLWVEADSSDEMPDHFIYRDDRGQLFSYLYLDPMDPKDPSKGQTWLEAKWLGEAPRQAVEAELATVRKKIKKEHSTTPRKQALRQQKEKLINRLAVEDISASGYISACEFNVRIFFEGADYFPIDREDPRYINVCIGLELNLIEAAQIPPPDPLSPDPLPPKPKKYTGPLLPHYIYQIEGMMGIDEVFEKPENLTEDLWQAALRSMISLDKDAPALSGAQEQAIEPLGEFMSSSNIDKFSGLQKPKDGELITFGEVYDYLFWTIKQKLDEEHSQDLVLRRVDPNLAVLRVSYLADYVPSGTEFIDGIECWVEEISGDPAFNIFQQEFIQYLLEDLHNTHVHYVTTRDWTEQEDELISLQDQNYQPMHIGIPTWDLMLENMQEAMPHDDMHEMQLLSGLDDTAFNAAINDFRTQCTSQIKGRILEIKRQIALCRSPTYLSDELTIVPEDLCALLKSSTDDEAMALFEHPQWLMIPGAAEALQPICDNDEALSLLLFNRVLSIAETRNDILFIYYPKTINNAFIAMRRLGYQTPAHLKRYIDRSEFCQAILSSNDGCVALTARNKRYLLPYMLSQGQRERLARSLKDGYQPMLSAMASLQEKDHWILLSRIWDELYDKTPAIEILSSLFKLRCLLSANDKLAFDQRFVEASSYLCSNSKIYLSSHFPRVDDALIFWGLPGMVGRFTLNELVAVSERFDPVAFWTVPAIQSQVLVLMRNQHVLSYLMDTIHDQLLKRETRRQMPECITEHKRVIMLLRTAYDLVKDKKPEDLSWNYSRDCYMTAFENQLRFIFPSTCFDDGQPSSSAVVKQNLTFN
jgi:hypothetical protein